MKKQLHSTRSGFNTPGFISHTKYITALGTTVFTPSLCNQHAFPASAFTAKNLQHAFRAFRKSAADLRQTFSTLILLAAGLRQAFCNFRKVPALLRQAF